MNLKDARIRKNMTQSEVAALLGVSSVVYSRYETGARQPSVEIIVHLADIFGVSVDYLLGRLNVEASTLTDYETELLIAARRADERARVDALNTLRTHPAEM